MNILTAYKNLKAQFPKELEVWLAGQKIGTEFRRGGKSLGTFVMPYFKEGKYIQYEVGSTTELLKKDGWTATYKITRIKRPGMWYDGASWDDGNEYVLKLYSIGR